VGDAARRTGIGRAGRTGEHGARERTGGDLSGLDRDFIPARFQRERRGQMPNWSHGLAGIAGSLAAAGVALGRPDLLHAARLGAEHLVTLADTGDDGMRVPHIIPDQQGLDTYT
jgi:hypothetical protein